MSRVNLELKLRLPPGVKAQLEALAVERGETVSGTVAALVALSWGEDAPPPALTVRAELAEVRREAKGRRARKAVSAAP